MVSSSLKPAHKLVAAAAACLLISPVTAGAQPSSHLPGALSSYAQGFPGKWLGDTPHVVEKIHLGANLWRLRVWSPANRTIVDNNVLVPERSVGPRPSFYLLPGIQGGMQGMNWLRNTDIQRWFANKNVTVVMPLGGQYSLYTDWNTPDPALGINKRITYLAHELPPLVDAEFGGTGVDAVGGLSSTGSAALDIAAHNPARFRAAASYSGCPSHSSPMGIGVSTALIGFGGGSSTNAWGLPGGPAWREHDPIHNLNRLRGVEIFVAAASGVPGGPDAGSQAAGPALGPRAVEQISNLCTNEFVSAARRAGVRVNHYYSPLGSHTFGLFAHEMKVSWAQTIARAIGARDI